MWEKKGASSDYPFERESKGGKSKTDQKNGQRQVKRRKKELLSEKINPLYMPQRNAIL